MPGRDKYGVVYSDGSIVLNPDGSGDYKILYNGEWRDLNDPEAVELVNAMLESVKIFQHGTIPPCGGSVGEGEDGSY